MIRPITRAERHGDDERDRDARQRRAEIEGERARARLLRRSPSATACGSGSSRAPASCEPTYQAAISSASETSLAPQQIHSAAGAVERAGVELARRADELGAADLGQHAV